MQIDISHYEVTADKVDIVVAPIGPLNLSLGDTLTITIRNELFTKFAGEIMNALVERERLKNGPPKHAKSAWTRRFLKGRS